MFPTVPEQLGEGNMRPLGSRHHQNRIQDTGYSPGVTLLLFQGFVWPLDLLKKKAIVQISTSKQLIGFYSTYFLVPEKDSGLKILTTAQILESIELGEWFTSVDLKDAYFHIPICQDHSPFLHFAFQDRVYQFRVLPFGLTLSPRGLHQDVFSSPTASALCSFEISVIPRQLDNLCSFSQWSHEGHRNGASTCSVSRS